MIAVITCIEHELDRGGRPSSKKIEVVSHGVNIHTLETVILPQVSLKELGAVYNAEVGSYVLPENQPAMQPSRHLADINPPF